MSSARVSSTRSASSALRQSASEGGVGRHRVACGCRHHEARRRGRRRAAGLGWDAGRAERSRRSALVGDGVDPSDHHGPCIGAREREQDDRAASSRGACSTNECRAGRSADRQRPETASIDGSASARRAFVEVMKAMVTSSAISKPGLLVERRSAQGATAGWRPHPTTGSRRHVDIANIVVTPSPLSATSADNRMLATTLPT